MEEISEVTAEDREAIEILRSAAKLVENGEPFALLVAERMSRRRGHEDEASRIARTALQHVDEESERSNLKLLEAANLLEGGWSTAMARTTSRFTITKKMAKKLAELGDTPVTGNGFAAACERISSGDAGMKDRARAAEVWNKRSDPQ